MEEIEKVGCLQKKVIWLECNRTHSNGNKCGWNRMYNTDFHDRWKDNSSAYPATLPKQHAYWQQVTKPCNNDTNEAPPAQVPAGTNTVIKERVSTTRVACVDMAKMVSDPYLRVALEKLWEDCQRGSTYNICWVVWPVARLLILVPFVLFKC